MQRQKPRLWPPTRPRVAKALGPRLRGTILIGIDIDPSVGVIFNDGNSTHIPPAPKQFAILASRTTPVVVLMKVAAVAADVAISLTVATDVPVKPNDLKSSLSAAVTNSVMESKLLRGARYANQRVTGQL